MFAGIGNNGQVESVINDFYYQNSPLYLMDYTYNAEFSTFKYNLGVKWNLSKHIGIRLRYGHSKTNNSYNYDSGDLNGVFSVEQLVTNLNPAVCLTEEVGKIRVSTGLEFAFFRVGDYNFDFLGTETQVSGNSTYVTRHDISQVVDGGKVTGINNFITIEYALTKRILFGTNASYGFMFAKFGDTVSFTDKVTSFPGNNFYTVQTSESKTFKEKYFSSPEVMFYMVWRFGKLIDSAE